MSEAAAPAAAPAAASETPSSDTSAQKGDKVQSTGSKPDASAKPEMITVKVNGKLKNLTRDDAIRELQKGFASRENFEKAAKLTKNTQALLKALQDPNLTPDQEDDYLRQLGRDPDKIAERRLALRAQQAQMTPEQKRIAELEAQLSAREKQTAEDTKRLEAERQEAIDKQEWSRLESDYMSVIDKAHKAGELGGMKPAEALYHMADAAEMNLEFGIQLTPEELLAEAKAKVTEAREGIKAQAMALEGPALLEFFGTDVVNKVLRAARDKFKAGAPVQPLAKPAPIAPSEEPKKVWKRPGDFKTPFL